MSDAIIPIKDRPVLSLKPKQPKVNLKAQKQIAVIKLLIELFPKCFFDLTDPIEKKKVKPLKIGIFKDIIKKEKWKKLNIPNVDLRGGLFRYTDHVVYHTKIFKSSYRINLTGYVNKERDVISKGEKNTARTSMLKRHRNKREALKVDNKRKRLYN